MSLQLKCPNLPPPGSGPPPRLQNLVFRWVNGLSYTDSEEHTHTLNALLCEGAPPGAQTETYSWVTNKPLSRRNVVAVATHGGRVRSKIENQGFNTQKISGLNLEHAYSTGSDTMKSFYYLQQIAHLFLQMRWAVCCGGWRKSMDRKARSACLGA